MTLATFFWHFRGWHCGHDLSCVFVFPFQTRGKSFWSHHQLFASLGPSSFHSTAFWIFPSFWVPPGPCKEVGGGNGQELRRTPRKTRGCLDEDWLFWEITGSHTTWQVAYFLYILHLVGATVVGWETNGWELCHLFFSYSTVQRFWASNVLLLGRNNGLWFFTKYLFCWFLGVSLVSNQVESKLHLEITDYFLVGTFICCLQMIRGYVLRAKTKKVTKDWYWPP